jgi:hypothetical protein
MKQANWLAVGLVLACTVFQMWLRSELFDRQLVYALIPPAGLVAISPVVFSIYAINLADRMIAGFDHQMIRLTPLTEPDILGGFTQAALFRLRVPRVITAGLAPLVALIFITRLGWYMPVYVEKLLTIFYGFGFAAVIWLIQRIGISFAVNVIYQNQPRQRALITTGAAVPIMSALLYFVTGLAAYALAVWVTLMTTVVF